MPATFTDAVDTGAPAPDAVDAVLIHSPRAAEARAAAPEAVRTGVVAAVKPEPRVSADPQGVPAGH